MATTANNFYIAPSDGWVNVAPTASKFLRVSNYPHTHPYYLYFGSSAPSLVPTVATGTITFSTAAPSDGNTVTIGSETYTFRTAPSLPFEVAIGASFHTAATNLTSYINANSTLVNAVDVSDVVTVTTKASGTAANIGLSKVGTNIAVSGAALTGGTNVALGVLVCHKPFWVNITTDAKCWARIINPTRDANGGLGQIRLDVVSIQ
jgi:hypothetical protein